MSTDRRRILGAVLALPATLTAAQVVAAAPAVAAGGIEAQPWADLVLEPGVTAQPGATPQVRLITIADTVFLQARGSVTCSLAADTKIATLPPGLRPTGLVRATAPRNNSQSINACRVEMNTAGSLTVYGGNSGNPITWVQFDSVQTIWR
ncbi:hypothetical protein LG634_27005 [Streptomyces bambusae]|uniref:hypothetical protein n=1 Tax=Streptomyces bambusae TaxID=1550616 RepID=UPI001CFCFC85|nr:hypothetical protein [Streptomyces bambusae]MCB5168459.1 hypothetical protein [Streptomyces bambusae]